MTVDRLSSSRGDKAAPASDVLLDGLFTGMIGAVAVALWFLIVDALAGRPFFTPSLLGAVLLHGGRAAAEPVVIAPLAVAAYTAFHFVVFVVFGLGVSYGMTLFERFPIMFFVLLVLFLSLQIGFFALNVALGASLLGQLRAWTVVIANLLAAGAMAFYQWRRHPSVMRGVERLWQEDEDQ
jgi:hypothetical protein